MLNVKQETLEFHTAESLETTLEMVDGLSELNVNASIYVAITGAASSVVNDYSLTTEVGKIFVAIKYKNDKHTFSAELNGERNEIREKAVYFVFDKVLEIINL